jgi:hypothetical protein
MMESKLASASRDFVMADVVIFGASMTAQLAYTYLKQDSNHRVVGFTVDAAYATAAHFDGLPLVPWERIEEAFPPTQVQLFGPLSFRRLNRFRRDRYLEGKTRGYRFISFIHPSCIVYAHRLGEHCCILPGTIVEPHATIGNNVVIWGGSYIAHHSVVGDHCFISALRTAPDMDRSVRSMGPRGGGRRLLWREPRYNRRAVSGSR